MSRKGETTDPLRLLDSAQRYAEIKPGIEPVFEGNLSVCGQR